MDDTKWLRRGMGYSQCFECGAKGSSATGAVILEHRPDCPGLKRGAPLGVITEIDRENSTIKIADVTGHDSGSVAIFSENWIEAQTGAPCKPVGTWRFSGAWKENGGWHVEFVESETDEAEAYWNEDLAEAVRLCREKLLRAEGLEIVDRLQGRP